MTRNYDDKKNFMLIQRIGVRLIGFWPGDDVEIWQIAIAVLASLELAFFVIFQIRFCIENIYDLKECLQCLVPTIAQSIDVIKILIIVQKRKEFKQILDFLYDAFVNGKLNQL